MRTAKIRNGWDFGARGKICGVIVSILNQKGGVGKTTTTLNLGAALANTGARVLLVDLDAQKSLSQSEPGHDLLQIVESEAATLESVLASQKWDYALLDCPPILGAEAGAALRLSRLAIAPTPARFLDIAGFALLREAIEEANLRGNPALKLRILLSMRDARFAIQNEYEANLRELFGGELFATTIPRSVVFERAADARTSVLALEPRSSGAAAFRALAGEILGFGASKNTLGAEKPASKIKAAKKPKPRSKNRK